MVMSIYGTLDLFIVIVPSIHFLHHLSSSWSQGVWSLSQHALCRGAEDTQDSLPELKHIHTYYIQTDTVSPADSISPAFNGLNVLVVL